MAFRLDLQKFVDEIRANDNSGYIGVGGVSV